MTSANSLATRLANLQKELRATGQISSAPDPELAVALQSLARGGSLEAAPWATELGVRGGAASARQAAGRLLVHLGVWDGHDDLDLLASPSLAPWPQEWVDSLPQGPDLPDDVPTFDLPWVSIDSVDPHEIDDAMWAEQRGDDIALWVAIASPTCWLRPEGKVERQALERAATLYHPRYVGPMLPRRLGEELASLSTAELRPAIVYELLIDPAGQRRTVAISEGRVRLHASWTYAQVQAAIDGRAPEDSAIDKAQVDLLAEMTRRSEANRVRRGAWLLYRPDMEVVAPRHGQVTLRRADQFDLARRLVGEAMVLCGMATADFFTERNLPAPFRTQPAPSQAPLSPGLYTEPADIYAMLRHMSAARSHVRAGSHAVLAADGYVQATSPLRRAGDLLAQRQLIAALRGKRQALSGSNIRKVMRQGQDRIRRQRAMERDGRRYFTLVALAQRGLGTRLRGQLVDDPQRQGRHLAFAMELCLPVELPGHAGEVGSWCEMEVEQILPMEGRVVVSVCS